MRFDRGSMVKPNSGELKVGDVVEYSRDNSKGKKRADTKQVLMDAYQVYVDRAPGSERLLLELTRNFLYNKMYNAEIGRFSGLGTSDTVDDWVQEALLDVWQDLTNGRVCGEFYGYLNSKAHFDKLDAFKYLMKQRSEKVSLEVEIGEDPYTGEAANPDDDTENRTIYTERAPAFNLPSDFTFAKSMLNGVEGVERLAAELILSGMSLKQAAEYHGLTEKALSMRFTRLREKMGIEAKEIKVKPTRVSGPSSS